MAGNNPIMYWLQESLGFKQSRNILAWGVAGGIAYYLWILPAQQDAARRKAIVEEWKDKYKENPALYPIDKIKKEQSAVPPLKSDAEDKA